MEYAGYTRILQKAERDRDTEFGKLMLCTFLILMVALAFQRYPNDPRGVAEVCFALALLELSFALETVVRLWDMVKFVQRERGEESIITDVMSKKVFFGT